MLSITTSNFIIFVKYLEVSATTQNIKHHKSLIPTKTKALWDCPY